MTPSYICICGTFLQKKKNIYMSCVICIVIARIFYTSVTSVCVDAMGLDRGQ